MGSHFLLQGIFPTQGSNPGLLNCRQTLYYLSHQRRKKRALQINFAIPLLVRCILNCREVKVWKKSKSWIDHCYKEALCSKAQLHKGDNFNDRRAVSWASSHTKVAHTWTASVAERGDLHFCLRVWEPIAEVVPSSALGFLQIEKGRIELGNLGYFKAHGC